MIENEVKMKTEWYRDLDWVKQVYQEGYSKQEALGEDFNGHCISSGKLEVRTQIQKRLNGLGAGRIDKILWELFQLAEGKVKYRDLEDHEERWGNPEYNPGHLVVPQILDALRSIQKGHWFERNLRETLQEESQLEKAITILENKYLSSKYSLKYINWLNRKLKFRDSIRRDLAAVEREAGTCQLSHWCGELDKRSKEDLYDSKIKKRLKVYLASRNSRTSRKVAN